MNKSTRLYDSSILVSILSTFSSCIESFDLNLYQHMKLYKLFSPYASGKGVLLFPVIEVNPSITDIVSRGFRK